MKRRVLVDVIARKKNYLSPVAAVFRAEWPGIWRTIRTINSQDHAALIRLLQSLEAWVIIERVVPEVIGRVPIVSLHDSLFARQRDLDVVDAGFRRAFKTLGFSFGMKRELWGPETLDGGVSAAAA